MNEENVAALFWLLVIVVLLWLAIWIGTNVGIEDVTGVR